MRTTSLPTPFSSPLVPVASVDTRSGAFTARDAKARAVVGAIGGCLICAVAVVLLVWGPLSEFAEAVALVLFLALATGIWMVACAAARLCRIADGIDERFRLD